MNGDILQSDTGEQKTPAVTASESVQPSFSVRVSSDPEFSTAASSMPNSETTREEWTWTPDGFAREQLRGLVQRIFFFGANCSVRQVVVSAAESRTDVCGICRQVGEILSLETSANVVVAAGDLSSLSAGVEQLPDTPKRDPMATRVRSNLWLTPGLRGKNVRREMLSSSAWCSRLCELRRGFEYSILEGPPAGESSESTIAGQVADGMILVLTAHGTRRAAVQWIQATLKSTQTRLLGTILAERRFPIPERLYRRL